MNRLRFSDVCLAMMAMLVAIPSGFAGSDRLIMSMTAKRMHQENLVYAQFLGQDGTALESDSLKQMVIREQDCSSGRTLQMIKDYKIGYAPKSMLVGIYLEQHAWSGKNLCFIVPKLGRIEQSLNPSSNNSRIFQLKLVP